MNQDLSNAQTVLELLHNRVSHPKLVEPAPQGEERERILASALRAPDHKILKPARYLLVEGDARIKLGDVFAQAAKFADPNATEGKLQKCRNMPLRAPLLVVAVSKNLPHPKVPIFEQEQSVAAGLAYILVALQASGYGGMWRTGDMAVNSYVKQALSIGEEESIVGFLYIGTPVAAAKRVSKPDYEAFFSQWLG